ncbi:MAG: putative enzyme related to lactoylglutathione lyase [Candidatus Azotimanducaceae bacterium]|jgi:predicted enzyme related to lactoylglutathione lyase
MSSLCVKQSLPQISHRLGEFLMPNKLAHFAIEADDVDRARHFYEQVFSWRFEAWGPPDFYLIHDAGVHGALQQRLEPLAEGRKGLQCSFAVDDLDVSISLILSAGGKTVGDIHQIPTVGRLVQFADTESNEAIIIQYEPERASELGLA